MKLTRKQEDALRELGRGEAWATTSPTRNGWVNTRAAGALAVKLLAGATYHDAPTRNDRGVTGKGRLWSLTSSGRDHLAKLNQVSLKVGAYVSTNDGIGEITAIEGNNVHLTLGPSRSVTRGADGKPKVEEFPAGRTITIPLDSPNWRPTDAVRVS